MAGAFGFQVFFLLFRNAGAHVERRAGLAGAGNIVELALNGHYRGVFDVARNNAFELAVSRPDVPRAIDEFEVLEHRFDGFEVVIGVHVKYGVVLVVKLSMCFGAGVIALDQVLEVVVVAGGVAVGVHGHKAGVLQKAGVDAPALADEIARNPINHVAFKPLVRLGGGQIID